MDPDVGMYSANSLDQNPLETIENILNEELIKNGSDSVILIDMAGNIIAKMDNGQFGHDLYSLPAWASANFAAMDTMAKIVGEKEFSLLFHKGENENIHFGRILKDYLSFLARKSYG